MGAMAANRSGCAIAMLQVPIPPIDRPLRYWRFASVLYSLFTSSSMASARLAFAVSAPQPKPSARGMTTMNGKSFSRFLIAGPMPTLTGNCPSFFALGCLVSPAPCRNRMTGYSFLPS